MNFNPRPPWGGRRQALSADKKKFAISIHALRGEDDVSPFQLRARDNHFNPRPPWGGRPAIAYILSPPSAFQSTPSVGRTTLNLQLRAMVMNISIHALRGEDDAECLLIMFNCVYFNPRPPWGGRPSLTICHKVPRLFQSTPSVGRTTPRLVCQYSSRKYFNPRPPWGGRRFYPAQPQHLSYFNPRPPWGGRHNENAAFIFYIKFQSTPSVGRTTRAFDYKVFLRGISIHALRGEDDRKHRVRFERCIHFNPRPPWGGRRSNLRPQRNF